MYVTLYIILRNGVQAIYGFGRDMPFTNFSLPTCYFVYFQNKIMNNYLFNTQNTENIIISYLPDGANQ